MWAVVPALVYLAFFCLYTWPWAVHFDNRFFTDGGDGLQNVWNMWWINRSVTGLHQLPWHTTLLHSPYGTSLLGQTMNPFNGFIGIGLQRVLTLAEAFNTMVVFSFVATGVTAFWLCHSFSRRYLPSLIGGFVCTFSAYHLTKTLGLMQLVSLEWVPLFVLLWWRLLTRPRRGLAVAAALVLVLVELCDFYYLLFTVLAALAVTVHLARRRELVVDRRSTITFAVAGALAVPLPAWLIVSNIADPMQGGHPSRQFSADVVSLFLDGGHWRFASLTRWYWGSIHTAASESTVYLSAAVIVLLCVAVAQRNRLNPHTGFWLAFAAVPAVLALGPRLVFHGAATGIPLPLAPLLSLMPLLDYNVEPDRIVVMTTLAAAVLVAIVLSGLDLRRGRHRAAMALVCAAIVVELWPAPPPVTPVRGRTYVAALARLPHGGVIDDAAVAGGRVDKSLQLYDQVLDGQPLAFGYVSRLPGSVAAADGRLAALIAGHRYRQLCVAYGFRYWTTPAGRPLPGRPSVLYADAEARIYGLC